MSASEKRSSVIVDVDMGANQPIISVHSYFCLYMCRLSSHPDVVKDFERTKVYSHINASY